jgi:GH15 family glucan-1,4-alpha-glucosidase
MKEMLCYVLMIILSSVLYASENMDSGNLKQTYYKLSISNGLISAVYDCKKNSVEYIYPHLFENYDSAQYVHPFAGNIKLKSNIIPDKQGYFENTHIAFAAYKDYTIYYYASFTQNEKIFYITIRGSKDKIENLSFDSETGNGTVLTGISMLQNPEEDLSVRISGDILYETVLKEYKNGLWEKYFMYSFTDSLHHDTQILKKAATRLKGMSISLVDEENIYMKHKFASCSIPPNVSKNERDILEQSISLLKMAQVSDNEIFPLSRGQVLAALRPGLWHVSWVRDGSFAIKAMTHLGMYDEAKKALEFMLKAESGRFIHYIYKDGKDYGVGSDYQISVCRYYGKGKEESTYVEGPNIEIDNFGLFLSTFADYVKVSKDYDFYKKWNSVVRTKVADVTVNLIDKNSLIREDSGPWEHYLQMPRQYAFTSAVCAKGLAMFAELQQQLNLPYQKYSEAAEQIKNGIILNMLIDGRYFKGNVNDTSKTDHEYYDAGVFEIFADSLLYDKELFTSHMQEYDKYLRIQGERPGYIRLNSNDPYENQEWVFINLRIALSYILYGEKEKALELINHINKQASLNYNIIPEMFSNKLQLEKMTDNYKSFDVWCNCVRKEGDEYIGAIPMIGYGAGAYVITLLKLYNK